MSLGITLLLAVFILLLLFEQLLRAARQRDQPTISRPEMRLRTPQPPAHVSALPRVPETARRVAMTRQGRTLERDAARPVILAVTPDRSTRRRTAVESLSNRFDLRRAIVLMAILGPCRASSSSDWPERRRQ